MTNRYHVFSLTALALGLSFAGLAPAAQPLIKVGPRAIPSTLAGPAYGLYTCQIVGEHPDSSCYDPFQVRHAYNIDNLIKAGFNGRGKTIVIVDAYQSPNIAAQLNYFDTFYGLPSLNGLGGASSSTQGRFIQIAPDGLTPFISGDENMTGWAEEISLDVLWAHAIAPGANITLVLAKSSDDADILSATKYAVYHHLGDVISQSFGDNESCVDPLLLTQEHRLFEDASARGITLIASSGDDGASQSTCDGSSIVQAVSSPASDPLVTAVGGTQLNAARYCIASLGCDTTQNPAAGTYETEIAWNEQPDYGASGGGFSLIYDRPSYQKGSVHHHKQRGVPDVAYNASVLYGVLTYLNIPGVPVGTYTFGGTSAGSPQWAALIAIADQKAGYNLGFINKALYKINRTYPQPSPYHDVTSGNNSITGDVPVQGFSAAPGWDPVTGLGSPKADQLIDYLIRTISPGDCDFESSDPHSQGRDFGPRHGHIKPH